ncbi:hypothetical protein FACS1894103_7060 [Campylobacterota bacterium]|nr:hypothetical protein FACS1894103_7060 [Campylobacterota bacterium]
MQDKNIYFSSDDGAVTIVDVDGWSIQEIKELDVSMLNDCKMSRCSCEEASKLMGRGHEHKVENDLVRATVKAQKAALELKATEHEYANLKSLH